MLQNLVNPNDPTDQIDFLRLQLRLRPKAKSISVAPPFIFDINTPGSLTWLLTLPISLFDMNVIHHNINVRFIIFLQLIVEQQYVTRFAFLKVLNLRFS